MRDERLAAAACGVVRGVVICVVHVTAWISRSFARRRLWMGVARKRGKRAKEKEKRNNREE